ncbi:ArnT family glycosyltransferase [Candidatus Oscillochloris fontis]|uniref:ArnT family glycosyltransferase n=1 Tax=Candidatus Oscillochloris fontis TaxID=2496868 RepID=UPI00101C93F2|nr:glycosyltransferase family 39 protein [Candidatus Oscillochloris fontis]
MKKINKTVLLVFSVVILAALIRVWGVNFGLPQLYHADESNKISIAQKMFKTGDLNPHYFKKPTLFIYLNALLYIPYYKLGEILGVFKNPNDISYPITLTMGVGYSALPTSVLMARLLSVAFSTATIPFIFSIGQRLSKKTSVGLLAALFLAVSPTHVMLSREITENAFQVFFMTIVVWASLRLYEEGKTIDYIIAGVATGLTISSKYPGVLIVIVPICAHFLRSEFKKGITDIRIYYTLFLAPITFLATTPFALLDYKKFLEDTLFEVDHYATGHPGMEGNSLVWYLTYAWGTSALIYLFALLEIVRGLYTRSKNIILLSVFPVVHFVFIISFVVRNDRTLLPLTPMLFVLSASFIVYIWRHFLGNRIVIGLFASLVIISLFQPIMKTYQEGVRLTTPDSRVTSMAWIEEHVPVGSRVALEAYAPFVNPDTFFVVPVGVMINYEPDWYVEQKIDYLVFGHGMYGRFYLDPERYKNEITRYNTLFEYEQFELIQLFNDAGYEVRIYQVDHSDS